MSLRFDPIAEAGRNWTEHDWSQTDAMLAATSITRAYQIMLARINDALAPLGLNFSRFEVLTLLSFTRAGELPMGKIGDRLQVHATSVTNTVDRLVEAGLVERVQHPTDGRTTLARLRPEGHSLVRKGQAALSEIDFGLIGLETSAQRSIYNTLTSFRQANGDFSE